MSFMEIMKAMNSRYDINENTNNYGVDKAIVLTVQNGIVLENKDVFDSYLPISQEWTQIKQHNYSTQPEITQGKTL